MKLQLKLVVCDCSRYQAIAQQLLQYLDNNLDQEFDFQLVDIKESPDITAAFDAIVVPVLIKFEPRPVRKVIGDFTSSEEVFSRLGIFEMDKLTEAT